jgi:hypothetical protein
MARDGWIGQACGAVHNAASCCMAPWLLPPCAAILPVACAVAGIESLTSAARRTQSEGVEDNARWKVVFCPRGAEQTCAVVRPRAPLQPHRFPHSHPLFTHFLCG